MPSFLHYTIGLIGVRLSLHVPLAASRAYFAIAVRVWHGQPHVNQAAPKRIADTPIHYSHNSLIYIPHPINHSGEGRSR